MICISQAKKYCREDISLIKGYAEAMAKAAQSNKHKRKPYGTNKNKGRKWVLCADGKRHWISKEETCQE